LGFLTYYFLEAAPLLVQKKSILKFSENHCFASSFPPTKQDYMQGMEYGVYCLPMTVFIGADSKVKR